MENSQPVFHVGFLYSEWRQSLLVNGSVFSHHASVHSLSFGTRIPFRGHRNIPRDASLGEKITKTCFIRNHTIADRNFSREYLSSHFRGCRIGHTLMGVVGEAALSSPVYCVGILAYSGFKIRGLDSFWGNFSNISTKTFKKS